MSIKPELILPAGDPEKARFAFEYGADAVYLGLGKYSMRKTEVRYTIPQIGKTIRYAHERGKKVYVTFNIFAHDKHLKNLASDIRKIAELGPDAFVVADIGVLKIVRENAPQIPIHISTQQNTVNAEAVKFWKSFGVKRVILARELSLKEIKKIHKSVPDIELEMFVHGALCISYSGRCLLSAYMTGREANLGDCAQPCRWTYDVKSKASDVPGESFAVGTVETPGVKNPPTPGVRPNAKFALEEKMRPGEYFPIEENENGTYIMSSKDLRLLQDLDKVLDAGVMGLKVEGRNKSIYYIGIVARAYRKALDALVLHTPGEPKPTPGEYKVHRHSDRGREIPLKLKRELTKELETLNYRGYTTGFAFGDAKKGETYHSRQPVRNYNFVAVVRPTSERHSGLSRIKKDDGCWNFIEVRNQIKIGDTIEVITPNEVHKEKVLGILDACPNDRQIGRESGKELKVVNPGKANQMAYLKLKNLYPDMTLMRKKI